MLRDCSLYSTFCDGMICERPNPSHPVFTERKTGSPEALQDEIGDLLFVIVNIARFLKVDPEQALRGTNSKFRRRFAHVEQGLETQGKTPREATIQEMERLWQEAKGQEAKREGLTGARIATFWILISQLAGGVLTILIVPLLHLAAPEGPWAAIASALLFGCGLLMPIVFAIGVWRYRLLDLDPDAPAPAS